MEEKELKIRESCPFGTEGALSNCNKNCGLWEKEQGMCTLKALTCAVRNLAEELSETNRLLGDLEMSINQSGLGGD